MRKTAEEMFEKLGYKFVKNNDDFLIYNRKIKYDRTRSYSLCFRKSDKNIILEEVYKRDNGFIDYGIPLIEAGDFKSFSIAVNKQIEELGW